MPNKEINQKSLELCWAIEELPASEQQTEISIKATELNKLLLQKNKNKENTALKSFSETIRDLVESYSDGKLNYAEMIGVLEIAKQNIYQELLGLVMEEGDNEDKEL